MNIKHCPPTRFDEEPRGTVVKVFNDTNETYYIQIGQETVEWITFEQFLGKVYADKILDIDWITDLIEQLDK